MAGSIAHDFNNLLSAMQTSLEAIANHPHDSERRSQALEAARAAAQRSQELTEQLLTFSRGGDVRAEPVDVAAVVREAIAVTSTVDAIETALVPDLPPVWVGRGQLHQILQNLLLNARDALGPGGRIRVSAQPAPTGVMIEVSDNGCGMTEAVRARALEPFFTTKPDGSGLGLSSVYGIVQQAGGSIDVSSEPGRGSSFRLTLPEAPPASQLRGADDGLPTDQGRRKVLICDDELRLAQLTAQLLDDHGFIGIIAGDARQAVEALAREADVFAILLDVRLPLGGAEHVIAALDDKGLRLPVLLTSGFSRDDVAPELVGHPVVEAYIQKPFTVDSLVDVLERLRSSAA
jgi:CheY-like chemotaxis protein